MKVEKELKAKKEKVNRYIQYLASQDARQPASAGMSYTKTITGFNGQKAKVEVQIHQLDDGVYSVSFHTPTATNVMTYTYEQKDPDTVLLQYEETSSSSKSMEMLNQKIMGLLLSRATKKQLHMRMDAFEKGLNEFEG